MSRFKYQSYAKDGNGSVITDATISVYLAGGTTAADVYAASSGGSAVASVTSDSATGYFYFWVDDGDYTGEQFFKIVVSKASFGTRTQDDIEVLPLMYAGTGTTAGRPTVTTVGMYYVDTDLGYIVYWDGSSWISSYSLVADANPALSADLNLDGNGLIYTGSTAVTSPEIGRLDGVTSNIQTQLNARVDTTGAETIAGVKTFSSFPITPSSAPSTNYQICNKKYVDDLITTNVGLEGYCSSATPLSGWLHKDGSNRSMTAYNSLHQFIDGIYGLNTGETFTTTFATNTINDVAHGLSNNDVLRMTTSAGDLPNGYVIDTDYYVINKNDNDYQVSLTEGGAVVTISDDGTGTHTYHDEFKTPDDRGKFIRLLDDGGGVDPDAASRTDRGDGITGDHVGTNQACENEEHLHTGSADSGGSHAHGTATGGVFSALGSGTNVSATTANATSAGGAHGHTLTIANQGGSEARPINTYRLGIIKY